MLFLCLLCVGGLMAAEPASMPSLKLAEGGSGTLKICSKPLECAVLFQGRRIAKDRAVLTMSDVKSGLYEIIFEKDGARLVKKARVMPGETTIIFGSLDSPEVVRITDTDPLKGVTLSGVDSAPVANAEPVVASVQQPVANAPARSITTSKSASNSYAPLSRKDDSTSYSSTRMYNESAEVMYELAEILRHAVNPFKARPRYRRALELYRKIITEYPNSSKVEAAHYSSGRIYESIYVRDYASAVKEYKQVLTKNPYTRTDAAARIAELYNDSKDLKQAAQPQLANIPQTTISDAPASASNVTPTSSGAYAGSGIAPITELTVESIKTVDAAGQPLAQ